MNVRLRHLLSTCLTATVIAACHAPPRSEPPRSATTAGTGEAPARTLVVLGLAFSIPAGLVEDTTTDLRAAFHPRAHVFTRADVTLTIGGCTLAAGPDACFPFGRPPDSTAIQRWQLDSNWTGALYLREGTGATVVVGLFEPVRDAWAVRAVASGPRGSDPAYLTGILRVTRVESAARR